MPEPLQPGLESVAAGRTIRRILVALDPMAQCQGALETAARLAARSEAELVGLFVEESELLSAAALPVTSALRGHDFAEEALDEAAMRRGLRAWASHAETRLAAAAARWRIKASFRVARGRVPEVLSAEARQGDLIAMGVVARPTGTARIGAAARSLCRGLVCPVLVMRGPAGGERPVLVVFDGSTRALAMGAELAGLLDARFEILITEEAQREPAQAWLDERGLGAAIERLADGGTGKVLAKVLEELRGRPARLVVLDRSGHLGSQIEAESLLLDPDKAVVVLG